VFSFVLVFGMIYKQQPPFGVIFVRRHYLFSEANSFARAKLKENYQLRGTNNVQGQIFEHILKSNRGYWVHYPSNIYRNTKIREYHSNIPQF